MVHFLWCSLSVYAILTYCRVQIINAEFGVFRPTYYMGLEHCAVYVGQPGGWEGSRAELIFRPISIGYVNKKHIPPNLALNIADLFDEHLQLFLLQ